MDWAWGEGMRVLGKRFLTVFVLETLDNLPQVMDSLSSPNAETCMIKFQRFPIWRYRIYRLTHEPSKVHGLHRVAADEISSSLFACIPLPTRLKSDLENKQKTRLCPALFFLTLGLKFVKPESDVKKKVSLFFYEFLNLPPKPGLDILNK